MAATVTRRRRPGPILGGILPFDAARLAPDMIAGATLAALAIPEVMGYANIAGMPVITGLYTLLLPILAFAIFGSSRHLVVGADSATAAILAAGLVGMGAATGSTEYVQLASFAALMCAGFLILARLLKLGFIANFLSRSVLVGFLTGVGIQVAMGQVGDMFGISGATGGPIEKFLDTLSMIPTETSVPTLAVSVAVLLVIVVLERLNKAIPGALIAVVGAIILSYALDLSASGVSTLGTVPGGLPSLSLPTDVITSKNALALLPTVISMVVVILAQSAATSRAYAMKYGDRFDENVDLVGLGLANAGAAISGTFVTNGSPTKTEMVDSAGGRSQISQLTAGAIVAAVLLFLTGPLAYMPNAVLAAVVFLIGLRLIDIVGMTRILRVRQGEFAVATTTAATVVVFGVEQGIILAMALSIIEHIYHSYRPYDTLVVWQPGEDPDLVALDTRAEARPGLTVYRFGATLYYANGSRFTEEIMDLVESADPPVRWLAVAGSSIGDVDYSGADTIRQVKEELSRLGVTLAFSDLSPKVRSSFDGYGLTAVVGGDRIFRTLRELVAAYEADPGSAPAAAGEATPPTESREPDHADAG
jgi:SulP family sulfate permease